MICLSRRLSHFTNTKFACFVTWKIRREKCHIVVTLKRFLRSFRLDKLNILIKSFASIQVRNQAQHENRFHRRINCTGEKYHLKSCRDSVHIKWMIKKKTSFTESQYKTATLTVKPKHHQQYNATKKRPAGHQWHKMQTRTNVPFAYQLPRTFQVLCNSAFKQIFAMEFLVFHL